MAATTGVAPPGKAAAAILRDPSVTVRDGEPVAGGRWGWGASPPPLERPAHDPAYPGHSGPDHDSSIAGLRPRADRHSVLAGCKWHFPVLPVLTYLKYAARRVGENHHFCSTIS